MRPTRRLVILGAAGAACFSSAAAPDQDGALRRVLDELAQSPDAAPDRLARLAAFDPDGLSASGRDDYETVRDGLAREAAAERAVGPAAYAARLAWLLGAERAPGPLCRTALAAARSLQEQADALLQHQGLTEGSFGEKLGALAGDARYLYPDDDLGRDQAVAQMNRWLEQARARLPQLCRDPPPAVAALTIHRMSPEEERAGRPGYRRRPGDEGPGGYWPDLHALDTRPSWSLPSVVHHELLPGHLLQAAIAERVRPHPLRLRYAAGYVEGWAIYAESLAAEQGAFDRDPLARVGYLHWRLFRLARVVADIGVNALGWDADRALASLAELQGVPTAQAGFDADLARLRAKPGAFAAEGIMALELTALRADAARRLGPRFDLRDFHDRILRRGPLPLDRLAREIDGWISL